MTLELNEREQDLLKSFIANAHSDVDFKRIPLSALSQISLGAEIAAKAKTNGISIDDLSLRFANRAKMETSRRMQNMPGLAERILEEAGLGMTEDDLVSNNRLAAEESATYGVGSFEEDVDMRRDAGRGFGVGDAERRQMRDMRNRRKSGKPVNANYEQKVQERFAKRQGDQVFFDSGLMPFDSVGADDKDGVEMIGIRGASEEDIKSAKRADREQGVLAKAENERRFRGNLTEAEMATEARLQVGKRSNEPLISATPDVGRPTGPTLPPTSQTKEYVNPYGQRETFEINGPRYEEGVAKTYRQPPGGMADKVEFDIRQQRAIRRHPVGNEISAEDAQDAILGQLRARKERGRSGTIDRIRQQNVRDRVKVGPNGLMVGQQVRTPNIEGLGKAKQSINAPADLGVVLSSQRPTGQATLANRTDGTQYYIDAATGNLAGNIQLGPEQQVSTYAEQMNAPQMNEAAKFVTNNAYDSYGAQNFGDESILSSMMEDSGSGGGVRQVEISGTLDELNRRLGKKGVVIPDGIRGIADLQAAAELMVQNNPKKKFFRREGRNNMVYSDNPGIAEVLEAMKYEKFEQEQIANALLQTQLAQGTDVNLDAKARYEGGGRMIAENRVLGSMTNDGNVVFGVSDPAKGGDMLNIAKAPSNRQEQFRQLRAQDGGAASKESTKPFVGQVAGASNRVGNTQVYKGMNPVQVREFYEQQDMENRIKKENKVGKTIIPSRKDEMALVAKIRAAQEGNITAAFNKRQADAVMRTNPTNMMGRIIPGREMPDNLRQMGGPIYAEVYKRQGEQLVQRANNMPVSQRPQAQLLQRPMLPTPSATPMTMGGDPQVATGPANPLQGPNQSVPPNIGQQFSNLRESLYNKGKEFATSNDPTIKRNRRIGYGGAAAGGLLAALIGGERDARNEEEQYR